MFLSLESVSMSLEDMAPRLYHCGYIFTIFKTDNLNVNTEAYIMHVVSIIVFVLFSFLLALGK